MGAARDRGRNPTAACFGLVNVPRYWNVFGSTDDLFDS